MAGYLAWLAIRATLALACLDAVPHLETRMRTEGLDIWLTRALRPGAAHTGPDLSREARPPGGGVRLGVARPGTARSALGADLGWGRPGQTSLTASA
ncbi:MAG TPA: hypothetical protein VGP31_01250 [Planosporangium sp.]|nr:hypothetical protein [Planosporangium sp.]